MSDAKEKAYAERFNRVFDHIDKHLEQDLSVECLSEIANFSKFHFHRQFSEYAGINVFRYIQLMRLKRASYRLAINSEIRIIEIALEAGFENPESFSRAFKKHFAQTPSQFRKQPDWKTWTEKYPVFKQRTKREAMQMMDVQIINFDATPIAVLEHHGDPALLNNTVMRFIEWRKQTGLSPVKTSRSFGVVYDNPDTTEPDKFRFDVCGSVLASVPDNAYGVVNKMISAGRCAVIRHVGAHDRMNENIYALYRDWLPQSGEELRDFPLFFHYVNLVPDVAESELITDVHLPLK